LLALLTLSAALSSVFIALEALGLNSLGTLQYRATVVLLAVCLLLLALVRVIFPSVAEPRLTAHSDGKDSTAIDSLRGDLMASAGAQDAFSGEASDASSSEAAAEDLKKDELSFPSE
jgi:hypothetical protein